MEASLFKLTRPSVPEPVRSKEPGIDTSLACLDALTVPLRNKPFGRILGLLTRAHLDESGTVNLTPLIKAKHYTSALLTKAVLALRSAESLGEGILLERTFTKNVHTLHLTPGKESSSKQSHDTAVRRTISNIRLAPEDLSKLLSAADHAVLRGRTPSAGAAGVFLLAVNEIFRSKGQPIELGLRKQMRQALGNYQQQTFSIQAGEYEFKISPYKAGLFERAAYAIGEKTLGYPKAQRWCELSFGRAGQKDSRLVQTKMDSEPKIDWKGVAPWITAAIPTVASGIAAFAMVELSKSISFSSAVVENLKIGMYSGLALSGAMIIAKCLSHLPISDRAIRGTRATKQ